MTETTDVTKDDPTTATDPGTPAAAPSTPSPAPGQKFSRDDVYDSDGKPWRQKFHGLRGTLMQTEKESAEKMGQLSAQLETAQQQLQMLQAEKETLTNKLATVDEEIAQIPTLNAQIEELKTQASLADKLKQVVNEAPGLLALEVEEEVPGEGEDAEPQTVKVNPILRLVENSTLEGDALRAEIRRLGKLYQNVPSSDAEPRPSTPSIPSPAEPSEPGAEYWRKKAMEAREKLNQGENAWDEHREAWAKYHEALAASG